MTLNQAIKTLNIEGRRLTVPSVRKLTGIKSDTVIRAAIDKFKADLSRKEKEKEEKSQMNVKCAEIVVRWRKTAHGDRPAPPRQRWRPRADSGTTMFPRS